MSDFLTDLQIFIARSDAYSWITIVILALSFTYAIKYFLKKLTLKIRTYTQKTKSIWDDVFLDIIDGLKPITIFISLYYILSQSLQLDTLLLTINKVLVVSIYVFQVAYWGTYLIHNWYKVLFEKKMSDDPSSVAVLSLLHKITQAAFLILLALIGLSNLNINISSLLTGLGIGGIAIALAAQNILGDIFASLSIILDKPFTIGDFIIVNEQRGTVEQIGIKTTKLRSLSGEEITISNKDLLESRIHNFKRMQKRRVCQNFGIVYSTPADKIKKIPDWIQKIVSAHKNATFDRCHFHKFGSSSLDYELIFYIESPDYNLFMDIQQSILLDIFKCLKDQNIDFAFPTQTIHIQSSGKDA